MMFSYSELEVIYKSDYHIKRAIDAGQLFKIERGIYSNVPTVHPLEILSKKYPGAIFTMDSAFYFHGLTDVIPKKQYLAVKRDSIRIREKGLVQISVIEKLHEIGKTEISYENVKIAVYSMERMLVELMRNKKKMAFDYYKEIVSSYRKRTHELDTGKIENYAGLFDIEEYIFNTIQNEVF